MRKRFAQLRLHRVAPLIVIGLVWQAVCSLGLVDPAFLPSPAAVGAACWDLLTGGEIARNLAITIFRALCGLGIGAIVGIWIGLMMARSERFRAYVAPIVGGTYSLPKSALIPLLMLWFGIGNVTAILAVFLACLLPLIVNTLHGVTTTPKVLVWSAAALGTSDKKMLWLVFFRHALPDIFTGLRMALGFSFVLAISAEMIASTNGIGKLIFMYGENGAYSYMFAAISSIVVVAFAADRATLSGIRYFLRWHDPSGATDG
jgi:NitT/TauT family transport system permease protein